MVLFYALKILEQGMAQVIKALLRVAAYCRVSTDKEDQANSLESQKRYFHDYIQQHPGWTLAGVYADEGISGTSTRRRTAFNRMIEDARNHQIDLILTKEVSRFARNTVDTLDYTRKLKEMRVGVLFITDNIDTRDNDGEFRLSIMASVAQEESRKTSERVRWGQRRSMERGVAFGSRVFGYTIKEGRLSVNPYEADIIRKIFNKYVAEGKGTQKIARELCDEGIRPPGSAQKWAAATILQIIKNEKYKGDLLQGKSVTTDYLTHKRIPNPDPDNQICLCSHHEPIVDSEIWERAQQERLRRSHSPGNRGGRAPRRWCSGRITCGLCGASYTLIRQQRKNGGVYETWACSRQRHGAGEEKCANRYLNGARLEEGVHAVLSSVTEEFNREKIILRLERAIRTLHGLVPETSVIRDAAYLQGGDLDALFDLTIQAIYVYPEGFFVKPFGLPMSSQLPLH